MPFLFSILSVLFVLACYIIYRLVRSTIILAVEVSNLQDDVDKLEREVSELTVELISREKPIVNRNDIFITHTQN